MHPLVIPLAQDNNGYVVGLMRWPQATNVQQLTVVESTPGSTNMGLLARSADEYIHRALAEEDVKIKEGHKPISVAAGSHGRSLYEEGAVARSGLPSLEAYLVRRVGMFCDVSEHLVQAHLDKGDNMSALITAEWYMRDGNFPHWGRPYEYVFDLMSKLGRQEEGRDIARMALRYPWWSLKRGFEHARDVGELSGDADAIRAVLLEQEEMANGGVLQGKYKTNPKTEQQQCIEEASHWMNKASSGEITWAETRPHLVEEYEKAGLQDAARFVAMV